MKAALMVCRQVKLRVQVASVLWDNCEMQIFCIMLYTDDCLNAFFIHTSHKGLTKQKSPCLIISAVYGGRIDSRFKSTF